MVVEPLGCRELGRIRLAAGIVELIQILFVATPLLLRVNFCEKLLRGENLP